MPEATIKYNNEKTLSILKSLSRYLGFVIAPLNGKQKTLPAIKGVTIIPADSSIDTSELQKIFTERKIDPKVLRVTSWQRKR